MVTVELTLVLILTVALVAVLARLVPVPLPLLWIAAGVVYCFVPGFGRVHIDPAMFFVLFIPPLLFADGWLMPRRDLKRVLRPVMALAFGLVLATVAGVGYAMHALIPSLPLAAAFALGAIVSPTDAVATAAMTQRLPLPRRVTLILNGESLINDASGLVAFKFAIAALATGTFSLLEAGGQLVLVAAGGALVGVAIGICAGQLHQGVARATGEPLVHTLLSLLTPFAAYLAAELVHASGILAVVTCGLYAGWRDARHMGVRTRQQALHVWSIVLFVFNGIVFLLLGLALPEAIKVLADRHEWSTLAMQALALWLIVTLIRLAWVYPVAYVAPAVIAGLREREGELDPRAVFIVGWAGLRGSVTMAAALSMPVALAAGTPYPGREQIIFLAASTILLTLLINGLTLPPFIRVLGLRGDGEAERELRAAELALARAATAALAAEMQRLASPEERKFAEHLVDTYEARAAALDVEEESGAAHGGLADKHKRLVMLALEAERKELLELRDRDVINDETARALEPRIDHLELYAAGAIEEGGH
ncbi:MAG: Na+/H+ antiporter [Burkholderiales bacterium]|nr:Na+/H+ antiporter [Burkholderiales bacterium]